DLVPCTPYHLSQRERSDREAIRVRGYGLSRDLRPLTRPRFARSTSPPRLQDSHISEAPPMLDGVELGEPSEHDNGAWLSVVAGPTAESCEDPRGVGKRALRVRVLLLCGFAFE